LENLQFLAKNKLAKVVEFTLENTHFEIGFLSKKIKNSGKNPHP
jgi:hypothetical protein